MHLHRHPAARFKQHTYDEQTRRPENQSLLIIRSCLTRLIPSTTNISLLTFPLPSRRWTRFAGSLREGANGRVRERDASSQRGHHGQRAGLFSNCSGADFSHQTLPPTSSLCFQHALRLLVFRQIHKVLGMDSLPASKASARNRKRRRDASDAAEGEEEGEGKKDKKEEEASTRPLLAP